MKTRRRFCSIVAATSLPLLSCAMEIQWTRMAGQWPVEASPLAGNFSNTAKEEILVLNRGGQLLLWAADGTAIGPGQDGLVAQLPEGRWTTAPTLVDAAFGARFVIASVEGQVIGLDRKFQPLWQHRLPGETVWGQAGPATLRTSSGSALVFNDSSGTATCLTPAGKVVWTNALATGPSRAPAQTVSPGVVEGGVLVPAGSTLFCCGADGKVRWRRDLGQEILTRPEVLTLTDRRLILYGTAVGTLFALGLDGKLLWKCATGDTFSHTLAFLHRRGAAPLI